MTEQVSKFIYKKQMSAVDIFDVYLSIAGHVEGQQPPTSEWTKGNIGTLHSLWKQEILIQPHHHLRKNTMTQSRG